jgi:hypothetical protein
VTRLGRGSKMAQTTTDAILLRTAVLQHHRLPIHFTPRPLRSTKKGSSNRSSRLGTVVTSWHSASAVLSPCSSRYDGRAL